jgi:cystathionine gamma-synthase
MQRHNETAERIAQFLAQHPAVRRVYYPSLPDHPDHAVAVSQMRGFGGVVSFELDTDLAGMCHFLDQLRIPYLAASLGGVESLVQPVAIISYYELSSEERAEIGITDSLVRLSVGIESADDLLADLDQALHKAFGPEILRTANGNNRVASPLNETPY